MLSEDGQPVPKPEGLFRLAIEGENCSDMFGFIMQYINGRNGGEGLLDEPDLSFARRVGYRARILGIIPSDHVEKRNLLKTREGDRYLIDFGCWEFEANWNGEPSIY